MKPNLLSFPLVDAESMGASITSEPLDIRYQDNISLQFHYTGTPTGTFDIQVSNDYNKQDPSGTQNSAGNWVSLGVSMTNPAGAAGDDFYDLNQMSAMWLRVVYTRTSGTGTLTVTAAGKMI